MGKVLVIAGIYFESQYFVDSIPKEKEFRFSQQVVNIIGSKMLNSARVLSKLGNEVFVYGKIGNDYFGEKARSVIKSDYSLNDEYVEFVDSKATGQIVVITSKEGNSAINLYSGANNEFTKNDIDKIASISSKFEIVYCRTNLYLNLLYNLVEHLKNSSVEIFIDLPNRLDELSVKNILDASFIAPNREEV